MAMRQTRTPYSMALASTLLAIAAPTKGFPRSGPPTASPTAAPIALRPQLQCGDIVTDAATTAIGDTAYHYFPFVVGDATPNITFTTCGSRDGQRTRVWDNSYLGGGTSLRLLRLAADGTSYDAMTGCRNCGDCGGNAVLGFQPYNATHLRPHFHEQAFDLGLMSGVAPAAAGYCNTGERRQFELGEPFEGYRGVPGPNHNLSSCASQPLVLSNYGYSIKMECLRNLSATCRCDYFTEPFARPGAVSMRGSSLDGQEDDDFGQPDVDFAVYCELDRNIGAWEQASFVHPTLDAQFCTTGSTRRFRAGTPDDQSQEFQFNSHMSPEHCLGNVTELALSGTPVYAWSMSNRVFDTQEVCTDGAAAGTVDSGGNDCSAYVDYSCHGAAIDLMTLSSPYNGSTIDASYQHVTSCGRGGPGGPQASGTERVLFAAIEPGGSISVRKLDIWRLRRFYMETRWGGGCPGEQPVTCTAYNNETAHTWTNDQATTEVLYIMVENYGAESGVFSLEWNVTGASSALPLATPGCSAHDDADFTATSSCCACGGGGTSVEHSGTVLDTCFYYTEPFLPHDLNHEDDDHDDYSEFRVYCETNANIGALDDALIPAGEYVLELATASWSVTDGDSFRLEMICDTVAPTPAPTSGTWLPVRPTINTVDGTTVAREVTIISGDDFVSGSTDADSNTSTILAATLIPILVLIACATVAVLSVSKRRARNAQRPSREDPEDAVHKASDDALAQADCSFDRGLAVANPTYGPSSESSADHGPAVVNPTYSAPADGRNETGGAITVTYTVPTAANNIDGAGMYATAGNVTVSPVYKTHLDDVDGAGVYATASPAHKTNQMYLSADEA